MGCSGERLETYPLTFDTKRLVSYSGTDTLFFLTEGFDTVFFIGEGRKDFAFTEKINIEGCLLQRNYQGQTIDYLTPAGTNRLELKFDSKRNLLITLFNQTGEEAGFDYPMVGLTPPFAFPETTINGKTYSDLSRFYPTGLPGDTLLYSAKYGIVEIKLVTGKVFTLLKN